MPDRVGHLAPGGQGLIIRSHEDSLITRAAGQDRPNAADLFRQARMRDGGDPGMSLASAICTKPERLPLEEAYAYA
jgi:hypothetical protein